MRIQLKQTAFSFLTACVPALEKAFAARYRACYQSAVAGGELSLRPANIDGVFTVDARSHIAQRILMTGCYEPDVTHALSRLTLKPGAIVNVGANVGLLAIYLAVRFPDRRIIAIEPNPASLALLARNIERNGLSDRIFVAPYCVSSRTGLVELSIIDGLSEYSSIAAIVHPATAAEERRIIQVSAKRLGEIVGDTRVALIFSDAEGAEELVFAGASDVLMRDHPTLFFECSELLLSKFGSSTTRLEALLNSFGYTVSNGLKRGDRLRHPFEGEAVATSNVPENPDTAPTAQPVHVTAMRE